MLRSYLPRALPASSALRCSVQRTSPTYRSHLRVPQAQQTRRASTQHAISNPTLADIEKRWERMPPQEQAELWMQLRDRMKVHWSEMTMQEKKAGKDFACLSAIRRYVDADPLSTAYWVSFGPHGPRKPAWPPGTTAEVAKATTVMLLIAFALFALTRYLARPAPHTMTKEYQEMTNEYLRVRLPVLYS